jgi:hypothetical protein
MSPGPNPFKTRVLAAPPNEPYCHPLEICDASQNGTPVMISAWEPSDEEIEAIKRGERLWLIIYGKSHPMVAVVAGERPPFL